jgi:2-polyprenyl-6-methoxyphenol hydroxylase-like FAD-dependent oxidoreductase
MTDKPQRGMTMLTDSGAQEHGPLNESLGGDRRPVVIVGAGPAGVMLAIELARRGIEVRVLDKQSSRPGENRAIGIHARTLEVMYQLGIAEEFLALGHPVGGVIFHLRGRRRAQVRFGRLDTPYPFLLTLSQEHTQRILDERLESLGVSIERGVEVVDMRHDAGGAELVVARPVCWRCSPCPPAAGGCSWRRLAVADPSATPRTWRRSNGWWRSADRKACG